VEDFARGLSILRRLKALAYASRWTISHRIFVAVVLQAFPFDKSRSTIVHIEFEEHPQSAAIVCAVVGSGAGTQSARAGRRCRNEGAARFLAAESCDEVQGLPGWTTHPIAEYQTHRRLERSTKNAQRLILREISKRCDVSYGGTPGRAKQYDDRLCYSDVPLARRMSVVGVNGHHQARTPCRKSASNGSWAR